MSEERTEKPTAKKRRESRRQGQVARTPELGAWAAMLLASLGLPVLVRHEIDALALLLEHSLRAIEEPDLDSAYRILREGAGQAFLALLVLGAGVMVIGVAGALAQGGLFWATKAVKPDLKKLNPVAGAKRIFGPRALWEGLKMLLKCAVVGLMVWSAVRGLMPLVGGMVPVDTTLGLVGGRSVALLRDVALAGLVMAAVDYAIARRRVGRQTRMTKEEVRQEHRMSEGDPLVRSAIRARQLAAARNRMMADVPTADVVLVNPTHVAVALRYDEGAAAPRVVARGAGVIARRIRETAVAHDVPLVRDVPLARALYASTDVGREIPAELFAAVAQVLAFVISRRARGQRGGEHGTPRSVADLSGTPSLGRSRRNPSDRRAGDR